MADTFPTYKGFATGTVFNGTTDTTLASAATFNVAVGECVVASVRWARDASQSMTAFDDDAPVPNSYAALGSITVGVNRLQRWGGFVTSADATTTFTATWGAACAYRTMVVDVFSPPSDGGTLDEIDFLAMANGQVATGTAAVSTTSGLTTDTATAILSSGCQYDGATSTWTEDSAGGYTAGGDDGNVCVATQYKIVTSIVTTHNTTMTSDQATGSKSILNVPIYFTPGDDAGGGTGWGPRLGQQRNRLVRTA